MENFIEKIINDCDKTHLGFRFSPENNGYLHIGHAKSICLNFGLSKKYNTFCNLRFDDTNPSNEKEEYANSIIDDIKWLGYTPDNILYASDYFDALHDYATVLIEKGLAYVDDSTSEEIALLKGTTTKVGIDSHYRTRSVDENLDLFRRMWSGEFEAGSRTLRAKISMSSTNMILRDPVIYRIIDNPHYKTISRYKIYPMYDFAHPLSDYIEGISHSICTMEFSAHRDFYYWVLDNLVSGTNPSQTEFARLNIDYTVMSKRKLKRLVEDNIVNGWDDPRLPTISGLRRRGYTPESIRNFCEDISVTKNESLINYCVLENCLRTDLNTKAHRLMGVMDPIKLIITNWVGGTEWVEIENNPEDESAGKRLIPFSGELYIEREDFKIEANNKYFRLKLGGEVRLKGGYIIKANDCTSDEMGNIIEVKCTYDPLTKSGMTVERKVKGTIHWVSVEHAVNLKVNEYDTLFTEASPDNLEDFTTCINADSLVINTAAMFEPHISTLEPGVAVQMIRKGYYCIDKDGGAFNKTVSLKESWKG